MSAHLVLVGLALLQAPSPATSGDHADAAPSVVRQAVGSGPLIGVVSDVLGPRGLELSKLGLGRGGVATERADPVNERDGSYRTAGGVWVRARDAGVKFDFPSGADLIVDTGGTVHLRTGGNSVAHRSGLRLVLADGAVIEIVPQGGAGRPPRHVEVHEAGQSSVLFRSGGVLTQSPAARAARESTLFVLGDGRALYRGGMIGPILGFERVICPLELEQACPRQAILIPADVLVPSLFDLVTAVKLRAANDPALQRRASDLAAIAPELFPFGEAKMRPPGARGELLVPLDNGFHLRLEPRDNGQVAADLWFQGRDAPECEWISDSASSLLHLFTRSQDGRLRYAIQGLDLRERLTGVLPGGRIVGGETLVRRLITEQVADDAKLPISPADTLGR